MSKPMDENRARQRGCWPIVVRRPDDADPPLMSGASAQERIAAVGELTRECWSLAGLDVPEYPRGQARIVVNSLSEPAPIREGS